MIRLGMALMLSLLVPLSTAEATIRPDRVKLLVHDGEGPRTLDYSIGGGAGPVFGEQAPYVGAMGFAEADLETGQVLRAFDAIVFSGEDGTVPSAHVGGTRADVCGAIVPQATCDERDNGGGFVATSSTTPQGNVVVVALREGAHVSVDEGSAWRVVDVPGGAFEVRRDDDDGSVVAGVGNDAVGVSAVVDAGLQVDYERSLAVAEGPCRIVGQTRAGAGRLTLLGGARSPVATCAVGARPGLADIAQTPTTWRLQGAAVGAGTEGRSRLIAIDLAPVERALGR
jgi:hypothetical protein